MPEYELEIHDWRASSPAEAAARHAALREAMAHEVFAPDRWPLFRLAVSLEPGRSRLHFSVDLLIADALSLFRLLAEWGRLYADPAATVTPPAVRFRDTVLSLEAARGGETYRSAIAYWDRVSDAMPPAPDLPSRPGPAPGPARFVRRQTVLAAAEWTGLRDRARRAGVTPTAVLLQAFAEVLGRWSTSPKFTVNLTTFQRPPIHPAVRDVVGDFTSTVLVDFDPPGKTSFRTAAKATLARVAERLDHTAVSGVEVLRRRAKRTGDPAAARMPIVFTSMIGLDSGGSDTRLTPLGDWTYGVTQTPQVLIDCQALPDGDRVILSWDTVDARFPDGLPGDMFAAYADRVRRLATGGDDWNAPTPDLLPEKQKVRRAEVNATAATVPDGLLHDGFIRVAEASPERIAVITPGKTLTYGELLARARGVAAEIGPVSPDELVAVLVGKGWEQAVAVFGVLLGGGAYLPIDPATPPARRDALLARTRVRVALVAGEELHDLPAGVRAVLVSDNGVSPSAFAPVRVPPSALAYVIFTSGSTGEPKGVMVEHRAAVNTVAAVNRRFAVGPDDRVLGLSSLGFDLSVYDLFGPLAVGGAVVLPDPARARDPDYLGALVRDTGVTLWNSVPMYLQLLLDGAGDRAGGYLRGLRLALLSGDWVPVPLAGRVRAVAPGCTVGSLGGATEAAVWSILHPIPNDPPADWPSVPYGKPLANQWFRVLDAAGNDCPDWVPGELAIGGGGLARGYWGDPERTAERFVTHPRTGERLYRTGDRGRYRPCGNLEFLGRNDGQVKVGGHRIELGEIEAVLARCAGVREAAAWTEPGPDGRLRLAAVFAGDADAGSVREYLRGQLPGYMIPGRLERIDRLPLTANGKVDRNRLGSDHPSEVASARTEGAQVGLLGNPPPVVGTITDAAEKVAFARRRTAVRGDLPAGVPLAPVDVPPDVSERRSHRRFASDPVPLADLARVLAVLAERPDGRFCYPSAGSAYPVQT
ncbi:MAG: amino acid adenylation domain-containing protein, partial [Fimbriiglobus sp.]